MPVTWPIGQLSISPNATVWKAPHEVMRSRLFGMPKGKRDWRGTWNDMTPSLFVAVKKFTCKILTSMQSEQDAQRGRKRPRPEARRNQKNNRKANIANMSHTGARRILATNWARGWSLDELPEEEYAQYDHDGLPFRPELATATATDNTKPSSSRRTE